MFASLWTRGGRRRWRHISQAFNGTHRLRAFRQLMSLTTQLNFPSDLLAACCLLPTRHLTFGRSGHSACGRLHHLLDSIPSYPSPCVSDVVVDVVDAVVAGVLRVAYLWSIIYDAQQINRNFQVEKGMSAIKPRGCPALFMFHSVVIELISFCTQSPLASI